MTYLKISAQVFEIWAPELKATSLGLANEQENAAWPPYSLQAWYFPGQVAYGLGWVIAPRRVTSERAIEVPGLMGKDIAS